MSENTFFVEKADARYPAPLEIREVTRYLAADGIVFENQQDALWHNIEIQDLGLANEHLQQGGNLLEVLTLAWRRTRPEWKQGLASREIKLLESLSRTFQFAIPYWQCRETPGYCPERICANGNIRLGGDVGSFSGYYASELSLKGLLHYAQQTLDCQQPVADVFILAA